MIDLKEIADKANMIINGYAFTEDEQFVRVLNLNHCDKASVFSKQGELLETSMDDIEISIVKDYFDRNKAYMR